MFQSYSLIFHHFDQLTFISGLLQRGQDISITTNVAVLDVCRTRLKLHILTESGEPVAAFEHPNQVRLNGPYPHFDTDAHWQWLLESLRNHPRTKDIAKIVPVTHGAAAALVDSEGLVLPILDYQFDDLSSIEQSYDALRDPFNNRLSTRLPAGLNLGRQLVWQHQKLVLTT